MIGGQSHESRSWKKNWRWRSAGFCEDLPDLAAPPGFLARTMSTLEKSAPWAERAWMRWPRPVRILALVLAFAVACIGWRAAEPGLLAAASRHLAPAASGVESFWNALTALMGALALAVEHLGQGFMLACLAAVAVACALCAGLGTMLVRLILARPGKNFMMKTCDCNSIIDVGRSELGHAWSLRLLGLEHLPADLNLRRQETRRSPANKMGGHRQRCRTERRRFRRRGRRHRRFGQNRQQGGWDKSWSWAVMSSSCPCRW